MSDTSDKARIAELEREGEVLVESITELYYPLGSVPEVRERIRTAIDRFKFVLGTSSAQPVISRD